MKPAKQVFNELIETIERNAIDNKAVIPNVKLWAKSWREEMKINTVKSGLENMQEWLQENVKSSENQIEKEAFLDSLSECNRLLEIEKNGANEF